MKKQILLLALISIALTSCKKSEKINVQKIPFEGTWTRSFKMASDKEIKVAYVVTQDSIIYQGPMSMNYTIKKDTFIAKDNKWIGNKNGTPYVIFVKNVTKDSITLLKMKVKSKAEAIAKPFPTEVARSKFTTWNTYLKK